MDAVFAGSRPGNVYLRYASPTVTAFEAAVASLEEAEAAQAYSSGMAAIHGALLAAGSQGGRARWSRRWMSTAQPSRSCSAC